MLPKGSSAWKACDCELDPKLAKSADGFRLGVAIAAKGSADAAAAGLGGANGAALTGAVVANGSFVTAAGLKAG